MTAAPEVPASSGAGADAPVRGVHDLVLVGARAPGGAEPDAWALLAEIAPGRRVARVGVPPGDPVRDRAGGGVRPPPGPPGATLAGHDAMCRATLWPLYHDAISRPVFEQAWWEAYVLVNEACARAVADRAALGATVWVHDVELQLVPGRLRRLRPDLRIGYFHGTPFPPYELFAQLPWRREVLDGLLGADLIGVQRAADADNLLAAARHDGHVTRRTPPVPSSAERGRVTVKRPRGGREVRVAAFPASVDARALADLARRPSTVARAREIRAELGHPDLVLLGVDRLEHTQGTLHRLRAVEELYRDRVLHRPGAVLVQVATPGRGRAGGRRGLRDEVETAVGRINGVWAAIGRPAVHYLHTTPSREELAALYLAADVLVVTALRDGMNLVAKEYVAGRPDGGGALVLSEFSGAAAEFPQAVLVNPHDRDGLRAGIALAATLPAADAGRRMRALRDQVLAHDVQHWVRTFLTALGLPEVASADEGPAPEPVAAGSEVPRPVPPRRDPKR